MNTYPDWIYGLMQAGLGAQMGLIRPAQSPNYFGYPQTGIQCLPHWGEEAKKFEKILTKTKEDKVNLWDLFQSKEMRLVKKHFFKNGALDFGNPFLQKLIFDLFKDKLIAEAKRLEEEKE